MEWIVPSPSSFPVYKGLLSSGRVAAATAQFLGGVAATAYGVASVKQSKLKGPNEPYLDPLSPLAPASPSSAFFASAVSGARRMGFEDAPSFMASRTMTL